MSYMDIDTWSLERAFQSFTDSIPDDVWTKELEDKDEDVRFAIGGLYCEGSHTDDAVDAYEVAEHAMNILAKLRLGVYDENLHGDMTAVLEEIERRLR